MDKIIIAGIGTEVGKTVVSAVMTTMLDGDYWKPIESGATCSDTAEMARLVDVAKHRLFPPAYSLKAPLSPHHAARLENITINLQTITPPKTNRPLIIEMVGGIFVPLNRGALSLELFQRWGTSWVIVSRHYLGSINHTLLTLEALKKRSIPILGIVFNGEPNPDSEEAILEISKVPCLGRMFLEEQINQSVIERYGKKWSK